MIGEKMMSIKALCGAIIIASTLLFLSSCNDSSDSYRAIVSYNGDKYEQYSGDLLPSGDRCKTSSKGNLAFYDVKSKQLSESEEVTVQTYGNDKNNIFITISGKGLLDAMMFHKIGDTPPTRTDESRISKIVASLPNGSRKYTLSTQAKTEYIEFLKRIIAGSKDLSVAGCDGSPSDYGVTTYFKDYPALDNSVMIKSLQNGDFGIRFSETSRNKQYLGDYDNVALMPRQLVHLIKTEKS